MKKWTTRKVNCIESRFQQKIYNVKNNTMTTSLQRAFCSLLLVGLSIPVSGTVRIPGEINGPCFGCELFNFQQRQQKEHRVDTVFCHYPCYCPKEELDCDSDHPKIKDGCGCCYMCSRQLGEACSKKDRCDADSAKQLYCDRKDDKSVGVCKAKHKKNPCFVDGATYQDGETFAPNSDCSQICTCQNGFYGCSSRCPHELVKPSELTCPDPKLIQVKSKCCKEWTCQKVEVKGDSNLADRRLEADNLIIHSFLNTTVAPPTTTTVFPSGERGVVVQPCQQKRNSDWTPCSVTCDTGVSVRTIVDRVTCATVQEMRLCLLRPCGEEFVRDKCTSTVKSPERRFIQYQDCVSVKRYRPKFCDTCKKNKCCYPKKTRERRMRFRCSTGRHEAFSVQWIKKCRCSETCYEKGISRNQRRRERVKRRRRNKQRREDNKKRKEEKKKRREEKKKRKEEKKKRKADKKRTRNKEKRLYF